MSKEDELLERLNEYKKNKIQTISLTFQGEKPDHVPDEVVSSETFSVTGYVKAKIYLQGNESSATFSLSPKDDLEIIPFKLLNSEIGRISVGCKKG